MSDIATRSNFTPMPDRLPGEREERLAMMQRALPYCQTFLGDYLRAILPSDLVLLTAWTGLGKTELAFWIACQNAAEGKRVGYFALEAEKRELERRRKYALIARLAFQAQHPQRDDLNYTDWYLGQCEHVAGEYDAEADQIINRRYRTLQTFYRDKDFTAEDFCKQVARISARTDLVVGDHLHYIDENQNLNETRALYETVKAIRDVNTLLEVPVLLVAHLRKKMRGEKQLVPELGDVNGTSHVTNVCTQVVAIAPATGIEGRWWFHAPTFVAVLKDRRSRPCPFVAVQSFDVRTKSYVDQYTLGTVNGAKWTETKLVDVPRWAKHHIPLDPQTTTPVDHPNEPGAA